MPSRRDFLANLAQAGVALSTLRLPQHPRVFGSRAPSPESPAPSPQDWRMVRPFRRGRRAAGCGVPGRPDEFYFGHVNGGVWKTKDAGRTWLPIFDDQPVASIGALTVAPSAPDVIYVGSGESTLRDSVGFGNGVYKSTDSGRTWQKVLYKDENVGAVEVVIDPTDSRVVYAGLWNTRRPPWFTYAPTNGPGGGIFKSTDGGSTWQQLTAGLPPAGIGRTGIAVAPSNPRRVYAVVDCLVPDPSAPPPAPQAPDRPSPPPPGQGGVFRSDDAGATWQ